MRKGSILLFILALILVPVSVYAVSESGESIEIKFSTGDGIYLINGRSVVLEPAFWVKEEILIPVNLLEEAFHADVAWYSDTKKVRVKLEEVMLILYADSRIASVDYAAVELPEPPVMRNGVTMVPLRFVADGFNAQVSCHEATGEITILKNLKPLHGIYTHPRIGDSNFGWSIDAPAQLKIRGGTANRNAETDYTGIDFFFSEAEISLRYYNAVPGLTLAKILDSYSIDYEMPSTIRLIEPRIDTDRYGCDFLHTQHLIQQFQYEDKRIYLNGSHILELKTTVPSSLPIDRFHELLKLVDTFSGIYTENDETQDLTFVDKEGNVLYVNEAYKLTVLVPEESGFRAVRKRTENAILLESHRMEDWSFSTVSVFVYSKPEMLLQEWAKANFDKNITLQNPENVSHSEIAPVSFGEFEAVGYTYRNMKLKLQMYDNEWWGGSDSYNPYHVYGVDSADDTGNAGDDDANINDITINGMDYYFVLGDYGYNVTITYTNNFKDGKEIAEAILESLAVEPLDKNTMGPIQRNTAISYDLTKKIKNDRIGISLDCPISLSAENPAAFLNIDKDISYSEKYTGSTVRIIRKHLDDFVMDTFNQTIEYRKKDGRRTETVALNGMTAVLTTDPADRFAYDSAVTECYYIISGDFLYSVELKTPAVYYNGSMYRALKKSLDTLKIADNPK